MVRLYTPETESRYEQDIKKSRFIACVNHCRDRQTMLALADAARREFPDARHVCWAFICGNSGLDGDVGFFDDGEPSGTAGKPILNVLQHKPLKDTSILVVRYFGGIKLGAGGLVRAYSGTASQALAQAKLVEVVDKTVLHIRVPFALEARVRRLIDDYDGTLLAQDYAEQVGLSVEIPENFRGSFTRDCEEIGKGTITLTD